MTFVQQEQFTTVRNTFSLHFFQQNLVANVMKNKFLLYLHIISQVNIDKDTATC